MSDSIFLTDGNGTITGLVAVGSLSGDLVIPKFIAGEMITSIGEEAFIDCGSLTSVAIPDSVRSIGWAAFGGCGSLTSVILNGVTSIGDYAFGGCGSLTYIAIPHGVTSIGRYAFRSCSSLTSITIPKSVVSIGEGAFTDCISLRSVTIQSGVTTIDSCAFFGCESLTSVAIPDSVTSIGRRAFDGCNALVTVYVDDPDNLSDAVRVFPFPIISSNELIFVKKDAIPRLVINKLTLDQYKAAKSGGNIADDEVYVITDIDEAIAAAIGTAIEGSY